MLKNIIRILPFFIVTLLSIGGVELFYGVAERYLFQPAVDVSTEETTAAVLGQPVKELEKHNNYEVIVERNLFKSYLSEPEPVTSADENPLADLEVTSLELVLLGTISGPEGDSRAIIMDKAKRKQDIFYPGDVVNGAQIKEIMRGKVILTYQGKDEVLDMTEAGKYKPRQNLVPAPFPGAEQVGGDSGEMPQDQPMPSRRLIRNMQPNDGEEPPVIEEPPEMEEPPIIEEPSAIEEPPEMEEPPIIEEPADTDGEPGNRPDGEAGSTPEGPAAGDNPQSQSYPPVQEGSNNNQEQTGN